jgi:hypothetical protein
MKIGPLEVELFRTDGQTDVTKLIVTFRNFAKASKMYTYMLHHTCCWRTTYCLSRTEIRVLLPEHESVFRVGNTFTEFSLWKILSDQFIMTYFTE